MAAFDRDSFAQICVDQALLVGVNPHYLVAVADLLSGISDDTIGDRIGCFRRTQADWNQNGTEAQFEIALKPEDINSRRMQCTFAALQTFRAQASFRKTHQSRFPSPEELYALWPNDPLPADKTLQGALDNTKDLIGPAEDAVLDGLDLGVLAGDIKLDSITAGKRPTALQIITAFQAAGYNTFQQAAALANAIAESGLNPNARNSNPPKEDSVGLFQLNMLGGVGDGHSAEDLKNPATNIALIIHEADKVQAFKASDSLQKAVSVFVHDIEKPADKEGETTKRLAIALKLLPTVA